MSGTKLSELRYKPFGEIRYSSGSTPTDKRFTSQEEQTDIGLYSFGARFFSPLLGRFISADTIVPRPSAPQSLNRYSYVENSPLNLVDPSGHCGRDPQGNEICTKESSTVSSALVVSPVNLKIEAAAKSPQSQGEIRSIPQDVTTMLVRNSPGGALSLVAPYAVALAPYAVSAASTVATTAAINAASRCLMSTICEKALNLINGQNNGFYFEDR